MEFSECLWQIVNSARSGQLSLWVGAGLSVKPPASRPLARELKFHILQCICSHPALLYLYENRLQERRDIGTRIESYPLEAFIQCMEKNHSIVSDIARVFRGGSPSKNHFLVARMMKQRFVREVLTTNFDLLIEKALESTGWHAGIDYRVYSTESSFASLNSDRNLPSVFKIHGTADDVESMRITLSQVASRVLSESRGIVLEHFLTSGNGDVLVFGYGAGDYFDINPVLSSMRSKKRIFYVSYELGKREISELPQAFHSFQGSAIFCDPDLVVDHLWSALGFE